MRFSTILLAFCVPSLFACSGATGDGAESTTESASQNLEAASRDHDGDHDADDHHGEGGLDHIFYIMMENHALDEIVGNTADAPYLNELASKYALATNYYGVTHPSLPNYLAAISGSFQGIWDDCAAGASVTCAPEEFVPGSGDGTDGNYLTAAQIASASAKPHWFAGKNLIDQLEEHRHSWKAYMQSIPGVGDTSEYAPTLDISGTPTTIKLYAQKHDPFMYFSDIRNNPERMKKIVPLTGFDEDMKSKHIPDFVWISPDQCHDMHGVSPASAAALGIPSCGYPDSGLDHGAIALGDAFVKDTVGKIMHSPAWQENSAIVIVWDEDDYAGFAGCCGSPVGVNGTVLGGARAPALVITSKHAKHETTAHPYDHYSLLGTIERLWRLGCLGETCKLRDSDLMTPLFHQ